ncbi:MAG: ATP-binding cassette domain-containing protein [Lachnospiraceae bacterium]
MSRVYGLLGPNGAGKSTLMNLITQNLEPDEGEILVNGISATKMGASYRDVLGYMPQQQGLYDRFSALEFLRYFASLKGLKAKESRKRIEELLEVVNLTKARNRKLGGFSGGMKQRVLLAQALLNEPQILILDEPTAGLDPKERIRIRNYISSISENKIVLIATHVVSDVECIAKEILFLRGGKLLEKETPEKLVEQMDGLVWEVIIRSDQLSQLEQVLLVSNVNIAKEGLLVRVIAESEQMKEQQLQFGWGTQKVVVPTLEDVYLYRMEADTFIKIENIEKNNRPIHFDLIFFTEL